MDRGRHGVEAMGRPVKAELSSDSALIRLLLSPNWGYT